MFYKFGFLLKFIFEEINMTGYCCLIFRDIPVLYNPLHEIQ